MIIETLHRVNVAALFSANRSTELKLLSRGIQFMCGIRAFGIFIELTHLSISDTFNGCLPS